MIAPEQRLGPSNIDVVELRAPESPALSLGAPDPGDHAITDKVALKL